MSRIVVIGGVAAGMSAASQAKRRRPEADVVVLERGPFAPVYDPVLIAATVARKRLHAAERKEAAAGGRDRQ